MAGMSPSHAPRSRAPCFLRETTADRVFIALNFARSIQTIALPDNGAWCVLLGSHHLEGRVWEGGVFPLPDYSVVIARRE
jgi:hypothetical protein